MKQQIDLEAVLVAHCCRRKFWDTHGNLFSEDFFTSEVTATLRQYLGSYWDQATNGLRMVKSVSLAEFMRARGELDEDQIGETIRFLRTARKNAPRKLSELEPVIKEALKRREALDVFQEGAQRVNRGDYEVSDLAEKLLSIAAIVEGNEQSVSKPFEDFDTLTEAIESKVFYTTGIKSLDDEILGGAAGGEVAFVACATKGGKTMFLCNVARANMMLPYRRHVVYFTYEVDRLNLSQRLVQARLRRPLDWVRENWRSAGVRKVSEEFSELWTVCDYRDRQSSVAHVARDLSTWFAEHPDVEEPPIVMVDYLDDISTSIADWAALTVATVELRRIAARFNVPIWTATQVVRAKQDGGDIGLGDIGGAAGKVFKADLILGILKNKVDSEDNMAVMKIIGARDRDVQVNYIPIEFDTSCQFIGDE